jgi:hypothetical protein
MLACIAILCAGFAVPGLVWVHHNRRWYPDTWLAWFGLIISIGAIVYCSRLIVVQNDPTLNRLDVRLTSSGNRKRLARELASGLAGGLGLGLALGLAGGLMLGLAGGLAFGLGGLALGLAGGLAFGLALGLMSGLTGTFSLVGKPTGVMRQNLAYALALGLTLGLALGLVTGLAFGLAVGLATGLAFGLASGLVAGPAAVWVRYVIGCRLARREGMLPRRVGQFFDWAYSANLLRMSGTAVQFRHSELQTWLTPRSPDLPAQLVRSSRYESS